MRNKLILQWKNYHLHGPGECTKTPKAHRLRDTDHPANYHNCPTLVQVVANKNTQKRASPSRPVPFRTTALLAALSPNPRSSVSPYPSQTPRKQKPQRELLPAMYSLPPSPIPTSFNSLREHMNSCRYLDLFEFNSIIDRACRHDVELFFSEHKPLIVLLRETRLNCRHSPSFPNVNLYRTDQQ